MVRVACHRFTLAICCCHDIARRGIWGALWPWWALETSRTKRVCPHCIFWIREVCVELPLWDENKRMLFLKYSDHVRSMFKRYINPPVWAASWKFLGPEFRVPVKMLAHNVWNIAWTVWAVWLSRCLCKMSGTLLELYGFKSRSQVAAEDDFSSSTWCKALPAISGSKNSHPQDIFLFFFISSRCFLARLQGTPETAPLPLWVQLQLQCGVTQCGASSCSCFWMTCLGETCCDHGRKCVLCTWSCAMPPPGRMKLVLNVQCWTRGHDCLCIRWTRTCKQRGCGGFYPRLQQSIACITGDLDSQNT